MLTSLLLVGCATGKYVGDYKDNKQHGQGTYTYANGDVHVGEFKDDKAQGQGTYTSSVKSINLKWGGVFTFWGLR